MALFGSTSETVRGSTESHLTRPGMEPAILGLPGTCRGRKLGDKPTVDIGSTSIFMQSPISFAWLRTRPVRRPHWISNPYSRTDKSEAAADGRTSESAPSFRLGVLLLLPNSMLVSAADERIGRSAEGTLVWIIDLVGYSWRAEVAGCGPGAKYGNVSWTPSRQAD